MISRKRLTALAGTALLVTSALVAGSSVQAAHAAAPDCPTLVVSVTSTNRILYRYMENATVTKDKVTKVLSGRIDSLIPLGGDEVSGGSRTVWGAHANGTRPRLLRVTNLDASDTLSVAALKSYYTNSLNAIHVTGSASYFVYGISPSSGNLVQWTRYRGPNSNQYYYGSPKVIAAGMSGLTSLTWTGAFKVDGAYRDFLMATTKSGALKQIQVPWLKPGSEKQTTLAASGFAGVVGMSPSFCNENPRYLSMIAIDGSQARWWTLGSQTAPSPAGLVNRGLVEGEHDWDLHAIG